MLRVGDRAPDAVLEAPSGPVRLSDLWERRALVLSFQRHFNCLCTRDQLSTLRVEHRRIVAAGGDVVAVLMGTPEATARFCEERDLPFSCLSDPRREVYQAFHLPQAGVYKWLLAPRVLAFYAGRIRRGMSGGMAPRGQDVRQMPGTFVIGRSGRIRMAHYSSDASDVFSIDDVLGALGAG